MPKHVVQTVFRLALWGTLVTSIGTLISCQKGAGRFNAQKPKETTQSIVIEEDLIPTIENEDSDEPIVKNGITYQAPAKKIKNKNAELLVGRVKMDKTKITYDQATRQMKVTGSARVLDENKTEIGSADFDISGSHGVDENRVFLKDIKAVKANSSEKPVVRAKVTCLAFNKNDEYDCSHAVVDFFIAYKKQIFTEQMELVQKTKPEPTLPEPPVTLPTVPTDDPTDDLQSEGNEDSIEGRYQGHAETADLNVVFEGDEGDPIPAATVDAVTPDVVVVTPPSPVKPATTTPSTPIIKPTPTTTPSTTPTPPPAKSEKPLGKDWLQLPNGDVRQVNQADGLPNGGRLRNATSLYTKQQALNQNAFFEVVSPDRNRHFGTFEITELVTRMGKTLNEIFQRKLFVGNVSQKAGGKLSPHLSHQIGVDVDLGYPTTSDAVKFPVVVQMKNRQYNPSSYSIEKTFQLLKFTFSQPDISIDRVFMDKTIKKSLCDYAKAKNEFTGRDKDLVNKIFNSIDHVDGHGDHFHVRLKCSKLDPGCRNMNYSVNKGCG